ncbi:MAG: hypothetical protein SGPRY_004581 [Prymnesium sp.]
MPAGAAEARAEQKAALAKVIHRLRTGEEMAEAVEGVRARVDELEDAQARAKYAACLCFPQRVMTRCASVRDAVEDFDKEARKSSELAEAEARLESEAFNAWKEARATSDFSKFAAKLSELFALKRRIAELTRPGVAEPYDGALDAFERGMTAQRLDEIFKELRTGLVPLLEAILAKKAAAPEVDAPHTALSPGSQWGVEQQAELSRHVAAAIGYCFENGRLDVSTHPFTGGAGPTDVRVTSRFSDNWMEGFGGTIHETGHALYEQGRDVSEEARGLPVSNALSMGVHESQSLLWERMVLQSRPFWDWATPLFHERFPFTKEASAEDFYRMYNRVEPGFIRVEADEVTYPLHVIMRYDIERALFSGEMEVASVPKVWNDRMQRDLGLEVKNDAQGCLQVRMEKFIIQGAIMATQIFNAAERDLGKASWTILREWLREKVHKVGSLHPSPDELLQSICGECVSPQPFLEYLKKKYSDLYELNLE